MAASTFIIADDHPLFRGALRQAVTGIDGTQTIIEARRFRGRAQGGGKPSGRGSDAARSRHARVSAFPG